MNRLKVLTGIPKFPEMELSLGTKDGISSAVNNFLSGMSWRDCSKFNVECVTSWTHLFAERDVTYNPSVMDNFIFR